MKSKEINVSLKFKTKLEWTPTNNVFKNLPDEIVEFFERKDGIMEGIIDQLYPDKDYEIEIKIKSL